MRLKDKIALVTGSSRGVGRAVALAFAQEGANVVVNYSSNETAANEVVDAIQSSGRKAIAVRADVAQHSDAEHLVLTAIETFGRLDILVNNAGFTRPAMLLKMKDFMLVEKYGNKIGWCDAKRWQETLDYFLKEHPGTDFTLDEMLTNEYVEAYYKGKGK